MGFLASICTAAIAAALFRMLVPVDKSGKSPAVGQISLLIVGVFLLTAVSAAGAADIRIDEDSYNLGVSDEYVGFSGEVNKELREKVCRNMADRVTLLLNENGFFPEQVHIIVNISGLYSIDIEQVKLVFGDESDLAAASELVSRELGGEIRVLAEKRE